MIVSMTVLSVGDAGIILQRAYVAFKVACCIFQ